MDLTHALAGPYCTMLLGDLGADVVKLEPPGRGDQTRSWGPPFIEGESSYFLSVNRNKRSLVLDLKGTGGQGAALRLARTSDVLVENLRSGSASRLGLGAEQLRRDQPELTYASISGFGQAHPTLTGYDQIAQGTSGLMSITGSPGGPPVKVGVPLGDLSAGMFTAHAILAALVERGRTGQGRTINVTLNDSLLALHTYQAGILFATGEPAQRSGNQHSTIVPYGAFRASDGFVNVAVGSDALFDRFCRALEASELLSDPRFQSNALRHAARPALLAEIERLMAQRSCQEWLDRFEQFGVPAGPILGLAEAFASPLASGRGMRVEMNHPLAGTISQVGPPWQLDGQPQALRRPPPTLGQHTEEILAELGLGLADSD
jgi:crotonobetainyl-CoA:carnitine CoA-transferase CaiB-like acyl-CoA transferase